MDNKKPISVRINQDKTSSSSSEPERRESSLEDYIRENHHPVIDDQHVYRRNYTPGNNNKNGSFWSKYKPLLISGVTAIVIGSFLGVIMLRMFINIDPEEVAFDSSSTINNQAASVSSEQVETKEENYQGKEYHFYVTQAGVFSSESAAEQLVAELKEENIDGMVWQRDDSYHVYVSLTSSQEASKDFTEKFISDSDDMYSGKPWDVNAESAALEEGESEWVQLLESSLEQMIEGNIDEGEMNRLLEDKPTNPSALVEQIVSILESLQAQNEEQSAQVLVLQVLYNYDRLSVE
ncbi:SPOR domain-containing protein [Gracilibacillus sp. S3-1-1]|uniref:SPOR domain-containing protein n=1 Tax=Gracilibacillus pellucidus TaxID=3095368 RepID=A0ACC6M6Q2_9BACI|nr:SPOR domain-containing protein [Gracilibacillus sp. S3-1-1]MDX8046571.1 SPOR domain-containing protein [Gracilibacillus sp. S3-1-1]